MQRFQPGEMTAWKSDRVPLAVNPFSLLSYWQEFASTGKRMGTK
jgi:hypothetical protein